MGLWHEVPSSLNTVVPRCAEIGTPPRKGEITEERYRSILSHGEAVIREAGLSKRRAAHAKVARWEDWRLVLFGREYPPVFRNYEEWLVGHGYAQEEEGE